MIWLKRVLKYLIAVAATFCLLFAVIELLGLATMQECFAVVKNFWKIFL